MRALRAAGLSKGAVYGVRTSRLRRALWTTPSFMAPTMPLGLTRKSRRPGVFIARRKSFTAQEVSG